MNGYNRIMMVYHRELVCHSIVSMRFMVGGEIQVTLSSPCQVNFAVIWSKKAGLVLALGTSLAAVGADDIVGAVSRRQKRHKGIGSVTISIQQTFYDNGCALRIFGKLDEVLAIHPVCLILPVYLRKVILTNMMFFLFHISKKLEKRMRMEVVYRGAYVWVRGWR